MLQASTHKDRIVVIVVILQLLPEELDETILILVNTVTVCCNSFRPANIYDIEKYIILQLLYDL